MSTNQVEVIAIVRHGRYDITDNLSNEGRLQIKELAGLLQPFFGDKPVSILTSTAPRALQSAEILVDAFGVKAKEFPFLWSGPTSPHRDQFDLKKATELIRSAGTPGVIVVTHLEYSEHLPLSCGPTLLGPGNYPGHETEKGAAWVLQRVNGDEVKITELRG
jgi:phosphohistidine phosphatase SixA